MWSMLIVFLCVLPSILIGMVAGYYWGRTRSAHATETDANEADKARVLKALATVLQNTERLTADVGSHNLELRQVGRAVTDMKVDGGFEEVQQVLLSHVGQVLESNQRLQDDLTCAKFRMEQQAVELDRTRQEARTDALAGINNRKAFDETMAYLLAAFHREQTPFSLILCDVDHFKWINDTHGHAAGDRVVSGVGALLRECIREGDHVARFGGDEFALLITRVDQEVAEKVADRIRRVVERSNFDVTDHGDRVAITFSMGLASVQSGDTGESLLQRADGALYKSKHAGRNQLHSARDGGEPVVICEAPPRPMAEEIPHEEPHGEEPVAVSA